MNRSKQNAISRAIANNGDIKLAVLEALAGETGPINVREYSKLYNIARDGRPRFSIFAVGNGKLPFLTFSALPGVGFCPGAGDCLNFCYSFRGHRFAAAYCRQAQNSMLLKTPEGRELILEALDKHKPADGGVIDFRLYVDGDFDSLETLHFWVEALRARPWLAAYGYSKSFELLLKYNDSMSVFDTWAWPTNYRLNLSSGHKYADDIKERVKALPITRGEFVAVNIGRKVKSSDHGQSAHNAELRGAYGAKAFTCPGKCGDCTPGGHACGSKRFDGIDIIIAVH